MRVGTALTAFAVLPRPGDLLAWMATTQGCVELLGSSSVGAGAVDLACQLGPDFAVLSSDLHGPGVEEVVGELRERAPDMPVLVVCEAGEVSALVRALGAPAGGPREGGLEVIARPLEDRDLEPVLERISLAIWARDRERQAQETFSPQLPLEGIWCFAGAGTGDGRTTFLLSVARALAQLTPRVTIVDADLRYGDVSLYLDMDHDQTGLPELLRQPRRLERPVLEPYLVPHPSGFQVLAPPAEHLPENEQNLHRIPDVVRRLELMADYVLVDLPPGPPELFRELIQESAQVVTVSTGQAERVKNHEHLLALMETWGIDQGAVRPVVIGADGPYRERLVRRPALRRSCFLPFEPAARATALRGGIPMYEVAPTSAYGNSVLRLVEEVLDLSGWATTDDLGGLAA